MFRTVLASHRSTVLRTAYYSTTRKELGGRVTYFDQYGTPILNLLALTSIPFLALNIAWEYLYLQEYLVEKEQRLNNLKIKYQQLQPQSTTAES